MQRGLRWLRLVDGVEMQVGARLWSVAGVGVDVVFTPPRGKRHVGVGSATNAQLNATTNIMTI